MNAAVTYLPDARDDIDGVYHAYEQRRAGLGDQFLGRLRQSVEAISKNPEMHAVISDNIRATPLRQFPYLVYYRFERNRIFVLAVLHGHRDPSAWQNRY